VDNLTECYFPGAIAPADWASCTVGPIVTKLPTCRYLLHFGFAKNSFFILTNLQLVLLSRQRQQHLLRAHPVVLEQLQICGTIRRLWILHPGGHEVPGWVPSKNVSSIMHLF
jgi:hypothetical protein